jgi:hypothetical protein
MSVSNYDDDRDLIRVVEQYHDLEPGTPVEARANDASVPVGQRGVVLRQMPESGNWQCLFEIEGKRRVVSLCPDQLRPVGEPTRNKVLDLISKAHDPVQHDEPARQEIREQAIAKLATDEAKRRRADGLRAYHERKRAEKAAAREAQPEPPEPEPEQPPIAMTPEHLEGMRTAKPVPRTVRPVTVVTPPVAVPLSVAASPIALLSARTVPVDWIHEASQLMRQVIGDAAGEASPAQLALLVEVTGYLETNREGVA